MHETTMLTGGHMFAACVDARDPRNIRTSMVQLIVGHDLFVGPFTIFMQREDMWAPRWYWKWPGNNPEVGRLPFSPLAVTMLVHICAFRAANVAESANAAERWMADMKRQMSLGY